MVKLTKAFIEKVETPETGYVMHWDDSVRGYLKFLVGLAESNDAQERDEALRLMRELGVMP